MRYLTIKQQSICKQVLQLLSISLYQGYFDFKTVNTRREKIRKFKLNRVNAGERERERERERKVKKEGART